MIYIDLFNGRETVCEQMDDWGEPGPIFGPFVFAQTTYACEITLTDDAGDEWCLSIVDGGLIFYDGMYYGDWSIFSDVAEGQLYRLSARPEAKKATPPQSSDPTEVAEAMSS